MSARSFNSKNEFESWCRASGFERHQNHLLNRQEGIVGHRVSTTVDPQGPCIVGFHRIPREGTPDPRPGTLTEAQADRLQRAAACAPLFYIPEIDDALIDAGWLEKDDDGFETTVDMVPGRHEILFDQSGSVNEAWLD